MDFIEFLKQYQKQIGRMPTEREIASIRSRMENGKASLFATPLQKHALGMVEHSEPNKALINSDRLKDLNYGTLIHELEHTDQLNRAPDSASRNEDIGKGRIPKPNLPPNSTYQVPNTNELERRRFQQQFPEVFNASNSFLNQMETFSNIAEYESTLPIGVSLTETPLGKKLKEIDLLDYVMSQIGGRNFSQSPENAIVPKETKTPVNPKASYARQALQYLGFKDPFEDTTKD